MEKIKKYKSIIFIVFIISMIIDMIRIIIFDKAKKILISIKEKF